MGPLKQFQDVAMFINFVCSLHHQTFASVTLDFLAALQLFSQHG
jgi:hypothetical protein